MIWHISKNVKPIPDRRYDWDFVSDDYDGADDGNSLAGSASSILDAVDQILEMDTLPIEIYIR